MNQTFLSPQGEWYLSPRVADKIRRCLMSGPPSAFLSLTLQCTGSRCLTAAIAQKNSQVKQTSDDDYAERQWKLYVLPTLSPFSFSASLGVGEVGWWLELLSLLSHSIYLFLISHSLFLFAFLPLLLLPPGSLTPSNFIQTFSLPHMTSAPSQLLNFPITHENLTLLSKQRSTSHFYQDSLFWLPIAAKTTPKTLKHCGNKHLLSLSWFLWVWLGGSSTQHGVSWPYLHQEDDISKTIYSPEMTVGAASLLGAELEWPSLSLCSSTCLVFL